MAGICLIRLRGVRPAIFPAGWGLTCENAAHRAAVLQTFPTNELADFPAVLRDALPALPGALEYRLVGNDLVIRDRDADIIVGVLRDAVGNLTTVRR